MPATFIRFSSVVLAWTTVIFGLIYLNGYAADSGGFIQTRMWIVLYMGAAMAAVMLAFMLGLYRTTRRNTVIFSASALVFIGSLYLVASQEKGNDEARMTAMIERPSLALVTNARADVAHSHDGLSARSVASGR